MTFMSVAGVSLGVAALIVVLSAMAGFEQDLRNKMIGGQPHVEIRSEVAAAGFSLDRVDWKNFQSKYSGIKEVEPFIKADIVLKQGKHFSAATMIGVDQVKKSHLWSFDKFLVDGSLEDFGQSMAPVMFGEKSELSSWPGIFIGAKLADQMGVVVGDEISALSPSASGEGAVSGQTLTRYYTVAGIFRTKMFDYDSKWFVVPMDEARKFMPDYEAYMDEESFVSGVALNLKDPDLVEEVSERILADLNISKEANRFDRFASTTWKDVNSSLLVALILEKLAMSTILALIVVVAAFTISGTLMMTVFYKRRQVSILRSIGATKKDVLRIFLLQGFFIGGVGVTLGLVFGLGISFLIDRLRFLPLKEGVYQLSVVPIKYIPVEYSIIALGALFLSVCAAVYPAYVAASQQPYSGLR